MRRAALRGWVKLLGLIGLALLAVPFIAQFQDPEREPRILTVPKPSLAAGETAILRDGHRPVAVHRPEPDGVPEDVGAESHPFIVYLPYGPDTGCSLGRDGGRWHDPCDGARYGADGRALSGGGPDLRRLPAEIIKGDQGDELHVTFP